MEWFAARVMSGKEYDAKKNIESINGEYEIYIPRQAVRELKNGRIERKTEKMMPGYLLIGSETVINTPTIEEFVKIIGRVTQEEIDHLRAQEVGKNESLELGAKIIIVEGPMAGAKGHIIKYNENDTVKCKIVFQNIVVEVDLRLDFISTSK